MSRSKQNNMQTHQIKCGTGFTQTTTIKNPHTKLIKPKCTHTVRTHTQSNTEIEEDKKKTAKTKPCTFFNLKKKFFVNHVQSEQLDLGVHCTCTVIITFIIYRPRALNNCVSMCHVRSLL